MTNNQPPNTLVSFPVTLDELCQRYEATFTAAINDVLREMGWLDQVLPSSIMAIREGMRVAGEVFTIKGAKSLIVENEMEQRAEMLEAIPENSVIVWDTSSDDESAQWGEVMTMAARNRGCRGAVVDGGVRDVDRVLKLDFPVFARYRTSNGMLGRFRISGWKVPIRIGKVKIAPGDIVFADQDGAIIIPRPHAYEVLCKAEKIRENESEIVQWVRSGMPPREVVKRGGYF